MQDIECLCFWRYGYISAFTLQVYSNDDHCYRYVKCNFFVFSISEKHLVICAQRIHNNEQSLTSENNLILEY